MQFLEASSDDYFELFDRFNGRRIIGVRETMAANIWFGNRKWCRFSCDDELHAGDWNDMKDVGN